VRRRTQENFFSKNFVKHFWFFVVLVFSVQTTYLPIHEFFHQAKSETHSHHSHQNDDNQSQSDTSSTDLDCPLCIAKTQFNYLASKISVVVSNNLFRSPGIHLIFTISLSDFYSSSWARGPPLLNPSSIC